jgi:hypothetical protein
MLTPYHACQIIVTCIAIARQRLGKHASKVERLFSMWSAPRKLLCNGAVKTPKIRDNRRLCFQWGLCKVVIKKDSTEQHRVKSRVSRRQSANLQYIWTISKIRFNGFTLVPK